MTGDREPPRSARPIRTRVADTDPGRRPDRVVGDAVGRIVLVAFEAQDSIARTEISAGPRRVDAERCGHHPGPACESVDGGALQPAACRLATLRGPAGALAQRHGEPVGAHSIEAREWLHGPDQDRGRGTLLPAHDVQTVIHPVDKVHVGDAGRPGHDPVATGAAEPRMRRQVVWTTVGLDLDDPSLAPAGFVLANQAGGEQDASGLGSVAREVGSVQDGQAVRPG
jgi:hypothetical protein